LRVLLISGSVSRLPDPVYPLGAAVVGTSLGAAGHEVAWFDALRHEQDAPAALEQQLEQVEPEVVMMSIRNIDSAAFPGVHRHFEEHLELARVCKRWGRAPLVLGGSGFSLMPGAFMAYLEADHGVVGEGERAAVELLAAIEAGDSADRLIRASRVTPPFLAPDRALFDADWYYRRGGMANLQTQRGCQLRCVYCTYPLLEGHKVRATEAEVVVDELEAIKRAGIDHAFIVDAVFNRPEDHAAAICEEVLRRGLEMSLTGYFVPQGKLTELPGLLKRAGFDAVELGTDSLSDPVLEGMDKGFTADEAIDFSRRLDEAGVKQCHNLIFGGPGETLDTMKESVERMDAIDPTGMIATIGLRIYPGTPLARTAGYDESPDDPRNLLEPRFYIDEAVADVIVDRVAAWVDEREVWVCPGLGKRYNPRYLARLRKRHKGPLWAMLKG
jgi:radical SAM superfamily enzyme YgiQ (UPF0313 family)